MPIPIYNNNAYEGKTVIVSGRVSDIRYKNDKLQIYLKGISISGDTDSANQKLNKGDIVGAVCYSSADTKRPPMGSTIVVSGRFYCFEKATNPGQFDMARYYQIKGCDFSLTDAKVVRQGKKYDYAAEYLYRLRCSLESVIDRMYEDDTAAVLKAMLLGNKDYLSEDIKDIFEKAGASHLLVISGTHIGLIGLGIYKVLRRLLKSLKAAAIISIGLIVIYGMMTGLQAATGRALIMFVLAILAQVTGRSYDMATAIGIAAVVALCVNPMYIYDAGFVLSFAAVMGVAIVYPRLKDMVKLKSPICDMCLVSLSINIFSLPFTLFYFYRFPVYSFFLNLILIPLVGVVLAGGFFSVIAGAVWLPLGLPGKIAAAAIVKLYIFLAAAVSKAPHAMWITGRPSAVKIAVYFVLLYLVLFVSDKKNAALNVAGLLLMAVLMLCPMKSGFHFYMLDVGQGDALLMYDVKHCVLVDGGSSSEKEIGKYRLLPALLSLGISRVDMIFVSHTDEDHVSGIKELLESAGGEGIEIKGIAMTTNSLKSEAGTALSKAAENSDVLVYEMGAGDRVDFGSMKYECLYPAKNSIGDANEKSMVLSLEAADMRLLLCGDIEGEGEKELIKVLKASGRYDLYKCAHHGSKGSSSEELLKKIRPLVTVISCGENNRYGHPHKEMLDRLSEMGSRVYTTKDTGAIHFAVTNNSGVFRMVKD